MMKVEVPFGFYKSVALDIADKIQQQGSIDELVAVSRGGLVLASIIARRLKTDVGYFLPSSQQLVLNNSGSKNIVFIEDLIATGKTLENIKQVMDQHEKINWFCVPFEAKQPDTMDAA